LEPKSKLPWLIHVLAPIPRAGCGTWMRIQVAFGVELFLRMYDEKLGFFSNSNRIWNAMDSLLVFSSVFDLLFRMMDLSILRAVRVFRALRVARVLRTFILCVSSV